MKCGRLLEVQGVWKRYKSPEWILKSLNLTLFEGEVVGIVGANGSGKTTLVRIASGLLRPSRGTVLVCGRSPQSPEARRLMGVSLHTPVLYPQLTVRENLGFYASLYGVDGYTPERDYVVGELGLLDVLDRKVGELSFGWRRRTDIARALIHRPRLLLLDEPFSGLDEEAARALSRLLDGHVSRGGGALVTSPDSYTGWLEGMGARMLRLGGGVLVAG